MVNFELGEGLLEEVPNEIVATHFKVGRDVLQNSMECSETQGIVARNRHVVLSADIRRQAKVAAGLSRDVISEAGEAACEILTRDVSGQPHTVRTLSRTK